MGKKEENYLPNKIVILKPIPKGGGITGNDPSHKGYFMWEGTSINPILPKDKNTGRLVDIFIDEEERKFFAEKLGVPVEKLNPYNKNNIFNDSEYIPKIRKDDTLMSKGKEYHLNIPIENIHYRILKACTNLIAASWEEKNNKPGEYRFVLVDRDEEKVEKSSLRKKKEEAWGYYYKLKQSLEDVYDFLYIYNMENKIAGILSPDESKDYYLDILGELCDNYPEKVISVYKDSDYSEKVMILKAIKAELITYSVRSNNFSYYDQKGNNIIIGNTLQKVVNYFKDDLRSEDKLILKARLDKKE